MKIYGKYRGQVEVIDHCSPRDCVYLVGEYQLAYGPQWLVWAGKRKDEPKTEELPFPLARTEQEMRAKPRQGGQFAL